MCASFLFWPIADNGPSVAPPAVVKHESAAGRALPPGEGPPLAETGIKGKAGCLSRARRITGSNMDQGSMGVGIVYFRGRAASPGHWDRLWRRRDTPSGRSFK